MDAKETSQVVEEASDADIKQELLDSEPPDCSPETMDELITKIKEENLELMEVPNLPETKLFNAVEDNPMLIKGFIKQEPKSSPDLELIKRQVVLWRVILQRLSTYTHTDVKQEPIKADRTDPDDVTTQSIPEGSEQHEMEDIKFVNTQDYLDISETIISKQDIAISEQDRATPGPTTKGDMRCHKNKDTSHLAGKKQFKCKICDYRCKQSYNLRVHLKIHTGELPFTCEICDYCCRRRSNLKQHVSMHHTGEKPYKCGICDFQSRQSDRYKAHMRKHTGEQPHKCDICDYQCNRPYKLQLHVKRMHTGEKPYKCEICDYGSVELGNLKRHMRTHTGEKPWKCDICNYQCKEPGSLKRHMRTHTGEKPNKCEICDYKCCKKITFMRHMRTHTGVKTY